MSHSNFENNFFRHAPFISEPAWTPVAKRVRTRMGNKYIADSQRVMLKRKFPMVYFFHQQDVNMELLEAGEQSSKSDDWGKHTNWHIKTDGKKTENAAWSYERTTENAPENIEKYIAFKWGAMDAWLEENEEVRVHPRDPYHRIDVCRSTRHVLVVISGETVAETRCPVLLFETGLPVRFYIPKTDVRLDMLEPESHQTQCPYKGTASYYSIINGSDKLKNVVWYYPFPNAEVFKIKDMLAFFTEKLDEVFINGEKLPESKTKWSE